MRHQTGDGPFEGRVDLDAVYAYARATNDLNPLYLNGQAVPPVFTAILITSVLWGPSYKRGMEPVHDRQGGVHGMHDVLVHASVRPGQEVRWQAHLAGLKQTRGGVIHTRRIVVSDMDGSPLVEHLWSDFMIGATIRGDYVASDLPDHTFPEESRARPIGARTVPVDRDQGFRYAGASGDRVAHSIDDEAARREGFPSKILQGLCTFGLGCGAVVDLCAGGDPGRLRRIAGRFSAPAFPGRDLVVHVYDAGRTEDGARAFAFEAIQEGSVVIKHGRAETKD